MRRSVRSRSLSRRRTVSSSSSTIAQPRYKQRGHSCSGRSRRLPQLRHSTIGRKASALAAVQTSAQTLDQHLETLRHEAARVVKAPGSQLKSAPFHSATNVKSLEAGAEVVILVVTPYWYGVETTDGQHGWINRGQLEPLP